MSKPRSERSRWTTIYTLPQPSAGSGPTAVAHHDEAVAVVKAFEAVGRIVRVESAKYGEGLVLKARRA
jgi:hypothetical protein